MNSAQDDGGPLLFRSPCGFLIGLLGRLPSFFDTALASIVSLVGGAVALSAVQKQNLAQASKGCPRVLSLIILGLEIRPEIVEVWAPKSLLQGVKIMLKRCHCAPSH